ncbi:MAG: exodeoxyribonuclease V subunit alpha [Lamprobacter sp.]|uniref:exodeoxyribonuclease V subunit alpha n=1 Tax=Lamprobacter sp. TaxID=3100796 RepID=UPI002B25DB40|nr:exodeoxyribonuclease V subunit alpha [Lamprobacter sp.]MEA3641845.1 exodeoxyribonuclease V subunit alpha [Lamprobacter sp.]
MPDFTTREMGTAGSDDRLTTATLTGNPTERLASQALLTRLSDWVAAGALRALDLAFTRFIADEAGVTDPAVLLAVALTSERNGHGHVCLDLRRALEAPERLLSRLRDDTELSPGVRAELREQLAGLSLEDWVMRLSRFDNVITSMLDGAPGPSDPADPAGRVPSSDSARSEPAHAQRASSPLVLAGSPDQPLLYLRRYWQYEQRIRAGIEARLAAPVKVVEDRLDDALDALFGNTTSQATPPASATPDCQRIACERAARARFFIITGGPGTGKTTTVVRLLALLQRLAIPEDRHQAAARPSLRIELAAPTGKAAARLTESIAGQQHQLPGGAEVWGPIPTQVKTLHRLLGTIPNSRHFRHHAANPLPADVVVVDEASMVDVELMAHLLDALRPDARLILLGDKDQLSSVEAGAVLGDLCQPAQPGRHGREAQHRLQQSSQDPQAQSALPPPPCVLETDSGLGAAIVILSHSYRFSEAGGIGALAKRVNQGGGVDQPPTATAEPDPTSVANVLALFEAKQQPALGVIEAQVLADPEDAALTRLMTEAYGAEDSFLGQLRDQAPSADADQAAFDQWAAEILQAQKRFQLLTPLRQGVWGVEGLNQRVIALLRQRGWLSQTDDSASPRQWFAGRPVMVTRNDYSLNLMNGDIGITLPVPAQGRHGQGGAAILRVAFPTAEGGVRWVLPSRLQAVETVFAMTVHKAQGSEFEHTALILPDRPNPVLTRELLYTAITRAKQRFTLLYSEEAVLGAALAGRVERASGLQGGWIGSALDLLIYRASL